jgi:hypothetical protein
MRFHGAVVRDETAVFRYMQPVDIPLTLFLSLGKRAGAYYDVGNRS